MLVNYLANYLYALRSITSDDCNNAINNSGWLIFLLAPWKINDCKKSQKARVVFINILYSYLSFWLWYSPPSKVDYWWGLLLLIYFGIVTVMDIEYKIVLYPVVYSGLVIGFIVGSFLHGFQSTILGGIIGYGLMYLLFKFGEWLTKRVEQARGEIINEEALGFGDVNLAGVIGFILGSSGIFLGLILTIIYGGIFSLIYLILMKALGKYKMFDALPYAPFLILSTISLLYFRDWLLIIVS